MTRVLRLLLATFLILSAPCFWFASSAAAPDATVRGSATYRERVALAPGAVFEARLLDVSRADAPARTIAHMRRENPGQVPISFEISYDPRRVDSRMRYVVRASIRDENRVRFAGESPYAVPAEGASPRVTILMRAVKDPNDGKPASTAPPVATTFAGLLPCDDCLALRYQLNLLPDGAYVQRMTYLRDGHDDSFYELGAWSWSRDGRTITLDGGRNGKAYWAAKDHETLRKLDSAGNPIRSTAPYELKRRAEFEPMEPRLKLSGMFRYMADAPRFRECWSGLEWPVSMSDDYRALERVYTRQRLEPGANLLVSLKGRVERRPRMEGSGTQAMLIVEKFIAATPGENCPSRRPWAGLENSRWVPTRIGERAVVAAGGQRGPWIELDSRSKRATGSGGCNRMSGSYQAGDGTLRFGPLMSTKMACPGLETETELFRALDRTRRYRVSGRTLELMDEGGRLLARLEERNLR